METTRLWEDRESNGDAFWVCAKCFHITDYAGDDPATLDINYCSKCGRKIDDYIYCEVNK